MNKFSNKSNKDTKEKNAALTPQQKIIDLLRDVVIVFVIFLLVYMLLFRVVVVDGGSMNNTLFHGDRLILLSSTVYRDPKPGDIVVASLKDFNNGKCIVKRVIAVEGQVIEIKDNKVFVDGIETSEPYAIGSTFAPSYLEGPVTVAPGYVFVMGDNRENSTDSRMLGQVDKREILGKVIFLLSPGKETGKGESDMGRIGVVKEWTKSK